MKNADDSTALSTKLRYEKRRTSIREPDGEHAAGREIRAKAGKKESGEKSRKESRQKSREEGSKKEGETMTKIRKIFVIASAVLFVTGSILCVVESVLKVPPTVLGPYTGPFGGLEIAAAVVCLVLAIDPDKIQTALLSRLPGGSTATTPQPPQPPQEPPK